MTCPSGYWPLLIAVLATSAGYPSVRPSTQAPTTDAILTAAGAYLQQFARDVNGVVAEEDYLQQAQGRVVSARRVRSEFGIIGDSVLGWIEFRDAFEVDGKPVRDRNDRVAQLFAHPSADALEQARRIVREGARFNLDSAGLQLNRTINLPMAVLAFLRASNQQRSKFERDRFETMAGHRTAVVSFAETARPRLIGSADNAAAHGIFWIEPDSGRVLRTQMVFKTRKATAEVTATILVEYADVPSLRIWLPKGMEEDYQILDGSGRSVIGTIAGRARYANFRKFNVVVDIKRPQL